MTCTFKYLEGSAVRYTILKCIKKKKKKKIEGQMKGEV